MCVTAVCPFPKYPLVLPQEIPLPPPAADLLALGDLERLLLPGQHHSPFLADAQ